MRVVHWVGVPSSSMLSDPRRRARVPSSTTVHSGAATRSPMRLANATPSSTLLTSCDCGVSKPIRRIASFDGVTPIPYGDVTEQTELRCGEVPASLLGEFARMAAEAVPNETGAWIVWERISGTYRLIALDAIHRSSARLEYRRPALNDSEVLVVDCHSHGSGHAYFSSTDDLDDRYDVKVALVLGHCDRAEQEVAMRLCAKGIFEQANPPASWLIAMNARASS